jgi:two-component system, NarL family, response regulator NreC
MIHIILADDHPILRQGLRSVIANEPGFHLVGEASSGIEALKLVEKHQPNVVVTDLMMPDLNGLEVTRQIRERHPRIAVVILSMQADEAYIIQALQSGARGYVLKDAPSSCLIEGIREAYAGRRYLSPPLSNRALEIFAKQSQAESNDLLESLTTREREVLQLTAEGKTSAEVARLLHISPRTVETHRANLMAKLRLNNQSEVIRYALRHGLLPLDG